MVVRPWTVAIVLVGIAGGACSQEGRFAKACKASTVLSSEVCECAARRTEKALSPKSIAFVIATLEKNGDRARELGQNLTLAEAAQAGTFMVSTSAKCLLDPGDE